MSASNIIKLSSSQSSFRKAALKGKAKLPDSKKDGILLRDFIFDRLYASQTGYFNKPTHEVGQMKEPLPFSECRGYWDVRKKLQELYPKNQWLTPSEMYKPYYGYMVGSFMVQQHMDFLNSHRSGEANKLRVFEIGPGMGGFALSFLEFVKNYNGELYSQMEYSAIEISTQLAEQLDAQLSLQHPQLHKEGRAKVYNGSFLDFHEQQPKHQHSFVLGFEVLDNLPHDRLYIDKNLREIGDNSCFHLQEMIKGNLDDPSSLKQSKMKIKDPYVRKFVELYDTLPAMDKIQAQKSLKEQGLIKRVWDLIFQGLSREKLESNIFAPTGALQLFEHAKQVIPNHTLLMADFDSFLMERNSIKGLNAPVVTKKAEKPEDWETHSGYLLERGEVDICFPSDFRFLQHAYSQITGKPAMVLKNKEFANMFLKEGWGDTKNGYNPIVEEYVNTSFLVTEQETDRRRN